MVLLVRYKEGELFEVFVDREDWETVSKHKWYLTKRKRGFYVYTPVNRVPVLMHAFLTGYAMTDHMNGNKLDNRRENLRSCNMSQNGANRGLNKNNTSGSKGVVWDKLRSKWKAQIKVNYKNCFLGRFTELGEAILAYDQAAVRIFGEFAGLNVNASTDKEVI